jgi:hypothetical protein
MSVPSELIDEIVRNVLRELDSPHIGGKLRTATSEPLNAQPTEERSKEAALVIRATVITEDVLESVDAGCRTVMFPSKAVITPSGREFIRRRQVSVVNASDSQHPVAAGQLMIIAGDSASASAAAAANGWKIETGDCDAAVMRIAVRKTQDHVIVCCCHQPSVVACLLNRDADNRVAVVNPTTDILPLQAAMNPRIVCFQHVGWSTVDVRRLLQAMNATTSAVPANWNEHTDGGTR